MRATKVEEQAATSQERIDRETLHLVTKRSYPYAICGFKFTVPWTDKEHNTIGSDRCSDCLRIKANRSR